MNKKLLYLLCLALPLQTLAQSIFNQNGVKYQLYNPDNTSPYAVVVGYTDIENQILEIPETLEVDGYSHSVTMIGDNALSKSSIVGVSIPNTVTSIGAKAFAECEELVQVIFPEELNEIGDFAFFNCRELTTLNMPASIKTIGDYAFSNCYNLENVVYKTEDPIAGNNTLFANSGYIHLYVANGGKDKALQIEPWRSFFNITEIDIDNIVVIDDIEYTLSESHTIYDPNTPIAYLSGNNLRKMSDVRVEESIIVDGVKYKVHSIEEYALSGCLYLQSITIPELEEFYISDRTFYNCKKLEKINLPKTLDSIGYKAFFGCSSLCAITIPEPNRYVTIYDNAFGNCGLKTLNFPESIDFEGEMIFEGCPIEEIYYDTANPPSCNTNIFNNNIYRNASLNVAPGTMEDFWTTEPWNMFSSISESYDFTPVIREKGLKFRGNEVVGYYFTEPADINIPDKVNGCVINTIGKNAFGKCDNLKSIYIPENISAINSFAFSGCTELSEITIPNSVTTIGHFAFEHCTGLKIIDLPNSITSIGKGAFQVCKSLESINLPSSLTEIEPGLFNMCESLGNIEIPSSVKSIGFWAFQACIKLKSVDLPDGLKTISTQAFSGCKNLEKIIIPPSVEEIQFGAFGCESLSDISYICDDPVAFDKNVFMECNYDNATLHIAKGARAKIMATEPWMHFKNIIEDVTTGIEDVSTEDESNSDITVYNINGVKIGDTTVNLSSGIYIIRQGSKVYKISI